MRTLALSLCFVAAEALHAPTARPAAVAGVAHAAAPPRMDMSEAAAAERVNAMVKGNTIFLFMKGSKLFPQCGFSNTATQILNSCKVEYETFDVLSDNSIREAVKKYSSWPTIPQCYINGEFIGGCDLMIEMYQNGELQEMVEAAAASA